MFGGDSSHVSGILTKEQPTSDCENWKMARPLSRKAERSTGSAGNQPADCPNWAEHEELDFISDADPGCRARHVSGSQPRHSARCGSLFGQSGGQLVPR